MRKTRALITIVILVVVLGLLTVSMALAGPDIGADSLASVSGGSSNPTGESSVTPEDRGLTLLLDQAPNQSNGLFSDADCGACATGQQSIADNFVLTDTYTIEEIIIWSGYFPGNSEPVDDIDVIFHSNAGTLPGAVISSEANVPAIRVQTGVILFGVNEWMTTLTLANPVELTAGTYWVEIFNNTVGNADNYFWEVGNLDPVNGILNNSFAQQAPGVTWLTGSPVSDNAIQIYGSQGGGPPAIAISKTPATQDVVTGGNANFTITVTNTGGVELSAVTVSDPLVPDCDNAIGTLATGATVSYACEDVGVTVSYTNVATVTSTVDTVPGPTASASAEVNVVVPNIAISKTPASQTIVTGGNADFTITVTNTGDVDLDNVNVVDPLVPACDSAVGALAVGASSSYSCTDVGVGASYTNVVTVTSMAGSVPGPSDSASAAVTVVPPTSVSLSGFGSEASAFSPLWLVALLVVVAGFGFVLRRKLAV